MNKEQQIEEKDANETLKQNIIITRKETAEEIKEKLQEEIFIANSFGDKLRKVPTNELENLLTYINELENLCNKTYEDLTKEIDRLEKENKDYYDRLNNLQTYIDNHEEIWKGNTKIQLQQFAERLKEKAVQEGEFVALVDIDAELNALLKEYGYDKEMIK